MVVLRDVRGLDTVQEEAAMRWAARALVEAMISDAGQARAGSIASGSMSE